MLSKPRRWRILSLTVIVCLALPAVIGGMDAILAIGAMLYLSNYVFLLPNFCLIVTAKQSWFFKSVHLLIFAVYFVPLATALFYSDEGLDNFLIAVCLLSIAMLLHFFYLIFAWRRIGERAGWKAVKFVVSMLVMCVVCTIVWDSVVAENLYNDTDDNLFGFLSPGTWVSDWDGRHPVVPVDHIVHGGNMSDPDTIKKGWTVTDLWVLWFGFIGVSVVLSAGAAWAPWRPNGMRRYETKSTASNCPVR